jgi:hypothetical protein
MRASRKSGLHFLQRVATGSPRKAKESCRLGKHGRVIAHELVTVIKGNVSVDWMHRDSARANIRRHVKRLLRKYGYPPDLQDAAVQNVLQQAEALSAEWAA